MHPFALSLLFSPSARAIKTFPILPPFPAYIQTVTPLLPLSQMQIRGQRDLFIPPPPLLYIRGKFSFNNGPFLFDWVLKGGGGVWGFGSGEGGGANLNLEKEGFEEKGNEGEERGRN